MVMTNTPLSAWVCATDKAAAGSLGARFMEQSTIKANIARTNVIDLPYQ